MAFSVYITPDTMKIQAAAVPAWPGKPMSAPLVEAQNISKAFPGVQALRGARLEARAGEIHALLGENGAGKSTLVKVLAGAHQPDGGVIRIDGAPRHIGSPAEARRAGIAVIYQEFNLIPALSVRDNLFLGEERTRGGFLSPRRERARARELLSRLGLELDPDTPCRALGVAQQQLVEVARALGQNARLLILDEPTSALTEREAGRLMALLGELSAGGLALIFITHRLDEVFGLARRATVMRDGETVATRPVDQLDRAALIEMMVGRRLEQEFPPRTGRPGETRLAVRGLSGGRLVRDVGFQVRRGEVLGLTGLVGSGRTETARLIFGADSRRSGVIELDGRRLEIRGPRDAIRHGICYLPEDRKALGLLLEMTARENFSLANLPRWLRFGFVRGAAEQAAFARFAEALRIRPPAPEVRAKLLSGGNQQKLMLARWLARDAEVILFDEPTRGVDVAAKYEIYVLIDELAARGKSVVMISSELPEVLAISDRILVMREGRVAGEIPEARSATQEQVMHYALS